MGTRQEGPLLPKVIDAGGTSSTDSMLRPYLPYYADDPRCADDPHQPLGAINGFLRA